MYEFKNYTLPSKIVFEQISFYISVRRTQMEYPLFGAVSVA